MKKNDEDELDKKEKKRHHLAGNRNGRNIIASITKSNTRQASKFRRMDLSMTFHPMMVTSLDGKSWKDD